MQLGTVTDTDRHFAQHSTYRLVLYFIDIRGMEVKVDFNDI